MKIVVLDGYTENPGDLSWDKLAALGELTVYDRMPVDDERYIIEKMADADIVYTNKTPIRREVIAACPNLKMIGVLATGYNVVDTQAARERRIPVCNIPTYGTAAVGQFAIALLLEICHHIGHHSQAVHEGRWERCADWCFWDYPLIELAGKTMGIIGFGRIGQATGCCSTTDRAGKFPWHACDRKRQIRERRGPTIGGICIQRGAYRAIRRNRVALPAPSGNGSDDQQTNHCADERRRNSH